MKDCGVYSRILAMARPNMNPAFIQTALPRQRFCTQIRRPPTCSTSKPPTQQRRTLLATHFSVLPLLVRTARFTWHQFWRVMMSELAPSDAEGRYIRPASPLTEPPPPLDADADYAVYVGAACQWCHRVMLARALLGMDTIELREVIPGDEGLWKLVNEPGLLKDVYLEREPRYSGRFTAPLLVETGTEGGIVSNESADILRMLGEAAGCVRVDDDTMVWLRPPVENEFGIDIEEMDRFCEKLYAAVNDGVYRCGFATSQTAYEEAQTNLFNCLDEVEARLEKSRFLFSPNIITESDLRLFPTVFRFDAVYAVLFKASRKTIRADYPAISEWIRDLYNMPGVPETCDLAATQENYYTSLFPLNPSGIVPITPPQDLSPVPERRGLGLNPEIAISR